MATPARWWPLVATHVAVPLGIAALTWWIEHNLRRAQAGLVPSSGSMSATGTYSGALGVMALVLMAYLLGLLVLLARWFREHRDRHPRLWAGWVRLRNGNPRPPHPRRQQ